MANLRRPVAGQLAQVDNPDPFARPVWRSPVYETPSAAIWTVQLARLLWRVTWFLVTHPALDAVVGLFYFAWRWRGWSGLVALVVFGVTVLVALRLARPDWFTRFVGQPARNWWRHS